MALNGACRSRNLETLRATILAPGSRGDVQPYIALGQALLALGHQCTIVTTLDHVALVRGYGLEVSAIPMSVAEELQRVETHRAVEGGGLISSFRQFAEIAKRSARSLAEVGLSASQGADVLVTNFSTTMVADGISRKLGVPVVQAFNVPITATSELPGALFPGLDFGPPSRRLGHALTRCARACRRSSSPSMAISLSGRRGCSSSASGHGPSPVADSPASGSPRRSGWPRAATPCESARHQWAGSFAKNAARLARLRRSTAWLTNDKRSAAIRPRSGGHPTFIRSAYKAG